MTDPITVHAVAKAYGDQQVLHDVDLVVREGEILGIIGPSGSGKSTLLRLLDLIEPATAGEISVFGVDVRRNPDRWLALRRRMGMLFQKPIVFNTTVRQNVALGLQYRGLDRNETERRVRAALEAVGLSHYVRSRAGDLSGGEQQRVALSRVLVTEPEILLLDEPTANLDPTSTTTIETIVKRMNREMGTTVVMNTHNLLQGQRLSDRVAVMMDGTIEQTGPPRQVFQAPASRAIATFVGIDNILHGRVSEVEEDLTGVEVAGRTIRSKTLPPPGTDDVDILIRGEDIDLVRDADADPRKNRLACTVETIESLGPYVRMDVDCGGFSLVVRMTARTAAEQEFDTGMEAWAVFRPRVVHLLPADVLR